MQTQMTVSLISRYVVGVYRRYSICSIYKVASECSRDSRNAFIQYTVLLFVNWDDTLWQYITMLSFPCIQLLLSFVIIIWCKEHRQGSALNIHHDTSPQYPFQQHSVLCISFFLLKRFVEFAKRAHMVNEYINIHYGPLR